MRLSVELASANADSETPQFSSKLALEREVLLGGISQGASDRLNEIVNKPLNTLAEATMLAGLTAAHSIAAQNLGGGFGKFSSYAAFGLLGIDLLNRGRYSVMALYDAWNHPDHFKEDRALIGDQLGRAFVDYPLYGLAGTGGYFAARGKGALGSRLEEWADPSLTPVNRRVDDGRLDYATKFALEKLPSDSELGNLYRAQRDAVVNIGKRHGNAGFLSYGSGFIVDAEEGYVATNYHAVSGVGRPMMQLQSGHNVELELMARDRINDLALLRTINRSSSPRLQGVELAESSTQYPLNSKVAFIGFAGTTDRKVISPGEIIRHWGWKVEHKSGGFADTNIGADTYVRHVWQNFAYPKVRAQYYGRPAEPDATHLRRSVVSSNSAAEPGVSGSPIFSLEDGRVIGIHSNGADDAINVSHLNVMLDQIAATKPKMGWLDMTSHVSADDLSGKAQIVQAELS